MYKEFQVNSVELHVQLQVHFIDKLEIHRKNHSNVLLSAPLLNPLNSM